jgi:hypothetical protein
VLADPGLVAEPADLLRPHVGSYVNSLASDDVITQGLAAKFSYAGGGFV